MNNLGAYITEVKVFVPDDEYAQLIRIVGIPTSLSFCRSAKKLGWIEYQAFRWTDDPLRGKSWIDCIELIDDDESVKELKKWWQFWR